MESPPERAATVVGDCGEARRPLQPPPLPPSRQVWLRRRTAAVLREPAPRGRAIFRLPAAEAAGPTPRGSSAVGGAEAAYPTTTATTILRRFRLPVIAMLFYTHIGSGVKGDARTQVFACGGVPSETRRKRLYSADNI